MKWKTIITQKNMKWWKQSKSLYELHCSMWYCILASVSYLMRDICRKFPRTSSTSAKTAYNHTLKRMSNMNCWVWFIVNVDLIVIFCAILRCRRLMYFRRISYWNLQWLPSNNCLEKCQIDPICSAILPMNLPNLFSLYPFDKPHLFRLWSVSSMKLSAKQSASLS